MTRQSRARNEAAEFAAGDQRNRRSVASFDSYKDAERVVDYLSDRHFPVERTAIIGHDVRMVEQVVGRLNYGGAALRGAGTGAVTGAVLGWLFGLFNWVQPILASITLAVYGLVFGAVIGALIGLLLHALQGGRRDFAAVRMMQPSHYEVVVNNEVAAEAGRLIDAWRGEPGRPSAEPGRDEASGNSPAG